jgi:enoyl-CoA hydratase/carnithine racemase
MTHALEGRDVRLGNVVPHRTLDEYRPRFEEHFVLSRDDEGVLVVRVHTGGGPAEWSRGLLNAWNLLLADIGADRDNEVVVITGTGDAWIGGVQPESFNAPPSTWHSDELDEQYNDGVRMLERLVMDLDVPTIAAINGPGPRQELALLCDLEVLPADELLPRALELARQIRSRPRSARRLTHGAVRSWQHVVVQQLRATYAQQLLAMSSEPSGPSD